MNSRASIALLLPLLVAIDAAAADLPPGNCAAPQAATDLSSCDFSRKKLAGKDLHGARLAGAKLESTDFSKANLSGADLRGSNAKWAKFVGANLVRRLAAAIGYVVVKARDSVGLFLHSDKIDVRMDGGNSFLHLNNLLKRVQSTPCGSQTDLPKVMHQVAEDIRKRALVVVISDLFGTPEEVALAFAHFRKLRHDVIVFHVLDPMEIDLGFRKGAQFVDMETQETINVDPRSLAPSYQRVFAEFLEQYRNACASMNVDYRMVRTDQPVDTFVRAYLEERRRLSR